MYTRRLQALRRGMLVLALVMPLGSTPVSALAQDSSDWANCREVTDPDVSDRMELCAAHAGCRLVLKIHRGCTAVRGFLDRLGTQVGQGARGLFGMRREIEPDQLWEATQTENTRQLETSTQARGVLGNVRESLGKVKPEVLTGRSQQGSEYAYYGEQRSGQPTGWGTMVLSNGEMLRGQFQNGTLSGPGDRLLVSPEGQAQRAVGTFVNGSQWNTGAQVDLAGTVSEGNFMQGSLAVGTRQFKSGEREEGNFEVRGGQTELSTGKKLAPNGQVVEQGVFRGGRLIAGDRYADGRVVEKVDEQRTQRERLEAQQASALEPMRREREQREAEVAAREQRFQQDLQRLGAGELYALADQLREQRDSDRARQALRALITRFPNHPLAATAADSLTPARPPAPVTAAGTPPAGKQAAGAAPSGAVGANGSCLDRMRSIWSRTMARANAAGVTFYPGVSGRWELQRTQMVIRLLEPCAGDRENDRELENAKGILAQLQSFCTEEGLRRFGYRSVPAHCTQEYVDPQARQWFALYQAEHAAVLAQGTASPVARGDDCEARATAKVEDGGRRLAAARGMQETFHITATFLRLAIAELRACGSSRAHEDMVRSLQTRLDSAVNGCRQTASTPTVCDRPAY